VTATSGHRLRHRDGHWRPAPTSPGRLYRRGTVLGTPWSDICRARFDLLKFTGPRAYDAKTLGEVKQLHETATVTTPSSIVRDLDPAVERVILRCLEKDPDRRPSSALTVAAALPGGDPLAAALAAGETPSPDLLVAAGETEAFAVRPALAMTLAFVAVLLLFAGLASRASIAGLVPMDKPRDVLADRVEQVISAIGHDDPIADRADGFVVLQDYLRWAQGSGTADWWGASVRERRARTDLDQPSRHGADAAWRRGDSRIADERLWDASGLSRYSRPPR
jgi:hypothetical protein